MRTEPEAYLYEAVKDAIREAIYLAGARELMIPHGEAKQAYARERTRDATGDGGLSQAYLNAEWNATACTDVAITAVLQTAQNVEWTAAITAARQTATR